MMSFFLLCFNFSLNYISLTHSLKTTLQALKREEQSSLSPQTTKGQRTRKNILICARKVFARAGYVTLRMSDVAEESGVSMGALYRYFQNKDDLFVNLIGDIHEQMFQASRAQEHDFAIAPYQALLAANRGYMKHYHENRDVLRALIEAGTVDKRFRDVWWQMRTRHIDRFVHALKTAHGIETVDGVPVRIVVESMASLVEQSAYTWFAQEELNAIPISVETASQVVTRIWYRTFFADELPEYPFTEKL
jgi:AcrR family transcriptional regulator